MGEPTCCDIVADLKNTPVPMIDPMTRAVVLVGVNPRMRSESDVDFRATGVSNVQVYQRWDGPEATPLLKKEGRR